MPIYRITAPNGQTYRIEGPPGATDADVANAVMAQYPESGKAPTGPKESTIGSELVRGGKQVLSSARAGAESLFDANKAATEGVARSQAIGQEAGEGASFEALQKAYEKEGLLGAAKELPSQVSRGLAGQAANLATMYAGSKAGAAAGAPFGARGRLVGGAAGAAGALLPQFMGQTVQTQASEQMERGEPVDIDRTKAYTAAAGMAALEGAGTAFTLGKRVVKGILGIADDAALATVKSQAELVKAAERSLAASAGRGVVRGTAEIPVEVGQEIIDRYQSGQDLTSPEAIKAYGEAAYQAALIGTPIGGVSGVAERGSAQNQVAQQKAAEEAARPAPPPPEEIVPGAKLPEEAPVGTQGTLFTPREMGKRVPEPKEEPAPAKPAAVQQGEQLGLGLDYQRDYADLVKERETLKQVTQTPEIKTRIAELTEQMASYDEADIGQRRAEKIIKEQRLTEQTEQKAADEAAAQKFPGLAGPTTAAITQADIDAMGLPLRTSKQWLTDNVVGRTTEEIKALVQRDPKLVGGKGARAEVLKALIAPQPKAFEEKPNVPTTTKTDQPQGELDLGGGKPSVGVPSKPASTNVVQPGAGVPATTGASKTPDGLGLAPAGQPVSKGTTPQGAQPTAVAFKTSKGSEYVVGADSKTSRTKKSAGKGQGQTYEPHTALYVNPGDHTEILSDMQGGMGNHSVRLGYVSNKVFTPIQDIAKIPKGAQPTVGVFNKKTGAVVGTYAAQTTPKVGLHPVEKLYTPDGNSNTHIGNDITSITPAAPIIAAPSAPVAGPKKTPEPAPKITPPKEDKAPPAPKAAEPVKSQHTRLQEIIDNESIPAATRKQAEKNIDLLDDRSLNTSAADRKSNEDYVGRFLTRIDEARTGRKTPNENVEPSAAWADKYTRPVFNIVFSDDNIGLARSFNDDGSPLYFGVTNTGRYTETDIDFYTGKLFTPDQKAKLIAERAKAVFEESKKFAKNPDGPFTGAKTNVVKSESVDQRYADYLHDLAQSLGLGSVRFFLVDPADMRKPGSIEKYKLYKDYSTVIPAGMTPGEDGSKRVYGPGNRDFYISFKPGMSENMTLEVISHELGHAIQNIAYDNAPQETKDAIKKEYEEWLEKTKGKSGRELVQMLRNRETGDTQMMSVAEGKTAAQMHPYWTSFNEWFADNVSRWASTSEKPLSVTEKFFAKVAQMMRDLVAVVTGRKYPPAKTVAAFLDSMGPDDAVLWLTGADDVVQPSTRAEFSSTYTAQSVVDSLGPLTPLNERSVKQMVFGMQKTGDPSAGVKFRVATVDSAAALEEKFSRTFNGAVRDALGKLNPMGLYRQAQDYSKILSEYFQNGTLVKDKTTGLYRTVGKGEGAPVDVFPLIYAWGAKTGRTNEQAEQFASRVLEAKRLDEVLKVNPDFPKHLNDRERAVLVAEYNSDPAFAEMSAAMDKPRIALINKMVDVGRLSQETANEWKSVVGYVPFDRIEDFTDKFSTVKKTTGRSPLALTKDPELVGSFKRPVGNVFENYLNTMGWMVGQVMNNDARIQTLRGLEDLGFAKFTRGVPGTEGKTAKAYVNGEIMFWELPSRYDVAAFQDLNPPKMAIMRTLGAFSNILRKSVTLLPPFALKQVTDDVQRAMLTSGVKNPGALLRMTLANFGSLAWAELRGIQHPIVKEFGALGLTGEYDFEAGKPALSILKDLGYRDREALGSKTLGTILHRLDGITRASDLAVRKAIYEQTLIESNKDQLLAQSRAREFINFRRRGASEIIAVATATIPFFNAYVQGMDVLYRAASGKDSSSSVGRAQARQLFWSRAGTVIALSTMYAMMSGDDEDYQDMDLRTRNSNWILPGGYKIPVPGELGALFKVIPETVMEYLRRSGTPEEQTALEAIRSAAVYMAEQYIGRTVPIPQAVKPLIEAWTNYSFFTGRELEGIYQKQQDPSMRVTSKTSELAQAISNFSRDVIGVDAVSPIQIDNMLSGYFGSTAALVVMTTDSLLNPSRVDRPLHKYALLSNYMYDPVGTRSLTEFYDEREKVGKANNTLRQLMKTDIARAEAYAESHQMELAMESGINSTLEQLERTRAYRKFLNSPDGAAEMSKADREKELEEIKKMEIEFTRWVREAKAELRKELR